uniref:Lipocalin/cytosolic fatty-acid binding domain-containing protein n=1 Tax=Amblyomma maculatum TaxID=34609 RepID=G3MTK7_AMBMU
MNRTKPHYALSVVFLAFLFTFLQRTATSEWIEPEDLLKFLNTSEKIWVYNSSEESNAVCKVDEMINIDWKYDDYFFNRTIYTKEGRSSTTYLWGLVFTNKMLVGLPDTGANTKEELLYQDEESTCGVFEVIIAGRHRTSWWLQRQRLSTGYFRAPLDPGRRLTSDNGPEASICSARLPAALTAASSQWRPGCRSARLTGSRLSGCSIQRLGQCLEDSNHVLRNEWGPLEGGTTTSSLP